MLAALMYECKPQGEGRKLTGAPFNDSSRYIAWLLTVPLLVFEIPTCARVCNCVSVFACVFPSVCAAVFLCACVSLHVCACVCVCWQTVDRIPSLMHLESRSLARWIRFFQNSAVCLCVCVSMGVHVCRCVYCVRM